MKPHVHAEAIKAWADGAEIETPQNGKWNVTKDPGWYPNCEYRTKDPYRELKEAAADPTKEISTDSGVNWMGAGFGWKWNLPPDCYEVRDKPKAKVKMWQWIYQGEDKQIYTTARFFPICPISNFKWIGPALWTEIEVEE